MKNVHTELINAIKQKTPQDENVVNILTDVISISKEAAYRRLRGEIQFTLDEAIRIAQKFRISLDSLVNLNSNDQFNFHLYHLSIPNLISGYIKMLEQSNTALKLMKADPNSYIYQAGSMLPDSLTSRYKHISRFQLFKYIHQVQAENIPRPMSTISIPESIFEMKADFSNLSNEINTTFIIDNNAFTYFINYIDYFTTLDLITKEDVQELKKETHQLLLEMENMTLTGKSKKGKPISLYISNTLFDSTYLYLKSAFFTTSSIRVYDINYLSSQDASICENQKRWIENMMRFSTMITQSGEMERIEYFKKQHQIIDCL